MTLLGIDTSTAVATACVLRSDGEAFEVGAEPAGLPGPPAHARELLPAVADVMGRAAVAWQDLEAIAVGIGPGSFTGLRIGIATARGLAHGSAIPLRPVSSLAALAAGVGEEPGATLVLPLIDARRGEVFAALYEHGQELWPPFAIGPQALADRVRRAGLSPLAAGDGSLRFRGVLEAAGIRVAPDGSPIHLVRALHVCRLAARAPEAPPQAVLPDYVRAPDAKPQ